MNQKEGHRQRLKKRFAVSNERSLPDYEILEMILFSIYPRRDTKPLAKALLKEFGSLANIFLSDELDLHRVEGVTDSLLLHVRLLRDLYSRLLIAADNEGSIHILNHWNAVLNYLKLTMGFKKIEYFRTLYLNRKNILLRDKIIEAGTVDKIAVYPREIVKNALSYHASAVIIVHNHPSGDPKPSKNDILFTQELKKALTTVDVHLHDHIVVSQHNYYSFKNHNIL